MKQDDCLLTFSERQPAQRNRKLTVELSYICADRWIENKKKHVQNYFRGINILHTKVKIYQINTNAHIKLLIAQRSGWHIYTSKCRYQRHVSAVSNVSHPYFIRSSVAIELQLLLGTKVVDKSIGREQNYSWVCPV